MNENEVDIVAEELAKLGGTSWYPGREHGPVLRVVTERYRDRARAAIAALDRYRAQNKDAIGTIEAREDTFLQSIETVRLRVGTTVIYRPPGDRRAYTCTVDQVADGLIHLVPQLSTDGWVAQPEVVTPTVTKDLKDEGGAAERAS